MTYNKTFDLNLSDIDIIEICLRKELAHLSSQYLESVEHGNAEETEACKEQISEITKLLGKIHNQKYWYTGDPAKRWVPKG